MSRREVKEKGKKQQYAGKRLIMLAVDPAAYATIKAAADLTMRPVTQFVTFYAVQAATRIIAEQGLSEGSL